jgi:hypothetical protein
MPLAFLYRYGKLVNASEEPGMTIIWVSNVFQVGARRLKRLHWLKRERGTVEPPHGERNDWETDAEELMDMNSSGFEAASSDSDSATDTASVSDSKTGSVDLTTAVSWVRFGKSAAVHHLLPV